MSVCGLASQYFLRKKHIYVCSLNLNMLGLGFLLFLHCLCVRLNLVWETTEAQVKQLIFFIVNKLERECCVQHLLEPMTRDMKIHTKIRMWCSRCICRHWIVWVCMFTSEWSGKKVNLFSSLVVIQSRLFSILNCF